MRAWILAFSAGVWIASFIPALPSWPVTMLGLLPWLLRFWWSNLHLAAAFSLGLWWLFTQALMHQASLLPHALEQADLRVQAQVLSLPRPGVLTTRLTVKIHQGCRVTASGCVPVMALPGMRVRLDDYGQIPFAPGQRWQLDVRLKRPHGVANPGSPDTERRLFAENISATGYVRAAEARPAGAGNPLLHIERWRHRFLQQLAAMTLTSGAYIAALTIGEQSGLSNAQRQLLQATGTNHLMVISGLHIGLVAWLVFHLGAFLFRQGMTQTARWSARQVGGLTAVIGALVYSLLAGFSLPVQRAFIMVCCLMSGIFLVRQTRALNNLLIALLLVLLLDPLAVREPGCWLSFAAVAVLLSKPDAPDSATAWYNRPGLLLQTQGRVFLGLLPLTLLIFGQVSLLAPLVNLVAIPFIGLVVVPLCLLAMAGLVVSPALGQWLFVIPDWLLTWYEMCLEQLVAHSPLALLQFPVLDWWAMGLLVMAVSGLLLARQLLIRSAAAIAMILTLASGWLVRPLSWPPGTVELAVLDVGQGLAIVIQTRNHVLLYDTGPALDASRNAAAFILLPYLRQKRITTVGRIVISHGDNDHAGGVGILARAFPDAHFMLGESLQSVPQSQHCQAGQQWQWDAVTFTVLYPDSTGRTGNAASCVLQITTGAFSVLLPGDIEQEGELALVRDYRLALQSTVLIAPHHGSSTSSTPPFVRHVQPQHVVFTTGYLNRFGHPRDAVVARYRAIGSRTHVTSSSGMVRFRLSAANGVEGVTHYRETHPRFWADQP